MKIGKFAILSCKRPDISFLSGSVENYIGFHLYYKLMASSPNIYVYIPYENW